MFILQDSLAAEIEGTMRRELSVEEETAFQDQRSETLKSLRYVVEKHFGSLSSPPDL